jgi:hypothetical protein
MNVRKASIHFLSRSDVAKLRFLWYCIDGTTQADGYARLGEEKEDFSFADETLQYCVRQAKSSRD